MGWFFPTSPLFPLPAYLLITAWWLEGAGAGEEEKKSFYHIYTILLCIYPYLPLPLCMWVPLTLISGYGYSCAAADGKGKKGEEKRSRRNAALVIMLFQTASYRSWNSYRLILILLFPFSKLSCCLAEEEKKTSIICYESLPCFHSTSLSLSFSFFGCCSLGERPFEYGAILYVLHGEEYIYI